MTKKERRLFCDINPTCYAISLKKEITKRHIKNFLSKETFAKSKQQKPLANVVSRQSSHMIKRGPGIDPVSQQNKAVNIDLACQKINGILLKPGETFSFWQTVGKVNKKNGYKEGRVIKGNKLTTGVGGGLCNLGNTIHLLVLHSPLKVTEFHKHSDALAPDEGERVPFSSGTSIRYNYIDYRFKNNTDQLVQLLLWCDGDTLCGELRSERPFPWQYKLVEEDHHFCKEGDKYYRRSMIYREILDRESGDLLEKELVLNNRSEVMYDYDLIPKELMKA